jgi:hypothetical protein
MRSGAVCYPAASIQSNPVVLAPYSLTERVRETFIVFTDGEIDATMEEIEFTKDGIILREEVEAFGETAIEEKFIPYSELDEVEIKLGTSGFVSLRDLFEIKSNDQKGIGSILFQFDSGALGEAEVRPRVRKNHTREVPAVPHIDMEDIQYGGRKSFYKRMRDQPESQPATIRRIIYSEKDLTKQELDHRIQKEGYEAGSGGTSQSLVVLDKMTNDIERHGRGDEQRITWIGEE